MTRIFLLSLLGILGLSGCASSKSDEDRFFSRGWLWPRSRDEIPFDERKPIPEMSRSSTGLGEDVAAPAPMR